MANNEHNGCAALLRIGKDSLKMIVLCRKKRKPGKFYCPVHQQLEDDGRIVPTAQSADKHLFKILISPKKVKRLVDLGVEIKPPNTEKHMNAILQVGKKIKRQVVDKNGRFIGNGSLVMARRCVTAIEMFDELLASYVIPDIHIKELTPRDKKALKERSEKSFKGMKNLVVSLSMDDEEWSGLSDELMSYIRRLIGYTYDFSRTISNPSDPVRGVVDVSEFAHRLVTFDPSTKELRNVKPKWKYHYDPFNTPGCYRADRCDEQKVVKELELDLDRLLKIVV